MLVILILFTCLCIQISVSTVFTLYARLCIQRTLTVFVGVVALRYNVDKGVAQLPLTLPEFFY